VVYEKQLEMFTNFVIISSMKKENFIFLITIMFLLIFLLIVGKKPIVSEWTRYNSLKKSNVISVTAEGNTTRLVSSINNSLKYYSKLPEERMFIFGNDIYNKAQVEESLLDFKENLLKYGFSQEFFKYVKNNFDFYESATEKVLFTGYYEATLEGSYKRTEIFKYPLYKKPSDLVSIKLWNFPSLKKFKGFHKTLHGKLNKDNTISPYYSRSKIDTYNALSGRDIELVWVNDPVDLFFLHIQGSGIIKLTDGESIRVNYAGTNGHPYKAIGKYLVEKGVCTYKDLSMQYIKNYIKENPSESEDIFNYNPSYVFFRKVEEGPIGSLGVPVTPYHSIATDRYIFPRGAICYIETKLPEFDNKDEFAGTKNFASFVLNQDTGGAIRSPKRADLFTGNGKNSELTAGYLKEKGKLYFLIKKMGSPKNRLPIY